MAKPTIESLDDIVQREILPRLKELNHGCGGYNLPKPSSAVPVGFIEEQEDAEKLDAEYQQILKDDKQTQEEF
jgi:hypothetical protein